MSTSENFIAHLIELRKRLINAMLGFVVAMLGVLPFSNKLYTLLAKPMLAKLPAGGQMIATGVTTPFFVPIKVAAMAAFMLALPYILYQGWRFVAPGLYRHEKVLVLPLIIASTMLFLAGMAAAYFGIFPIVFGYILANAPKGVAVMTDIENYLNFALTMFVAFGMAFQVPVVVVVLVRMGVVSIEKLRQIRRYVILGATIAGAIFMPPDATSMLLFAGTLTVLYEAGLIVARWVKPAERQAEGEA
jgi:sec-independent protein translocase protein TatC